MFINKLKTEFDKREPWVTKFVIDGKQYGGTYDALNDKRVKYFFRYFPDVKTILELGSLEGGHTVALAQHPGVEKVIGIEGRKANIDKAKFIKKVFKIDNAEILEANIEDVNLSDFGQFDAVYCVGILYHLPKPWKLIEQISKVTKNLFIWTHYATEAKVNTVANGYNGFIYKEYGLVDPLSGLSPDSFWPKFDDLRKMLSDYMFTKVHIIEDDPDHQNGACVTLTAQMKGSDIRVLKY